MANSENDEKKNGSKNRSEYETRKIKLTEKSEVLFNDIDAIENKIYNLKIKLANDKKNKDINNELKELEKRKDELKTVFKNNNIAIQDLNERIFEKNNVGKNLKKDDAPPEQTFQRLYDSEDELPVVKVLAEDFRKQAEAKISSKIFSIQEITENLVEEFNSLDSKTKKDLEKAALAETKVNLENNSDNDTTTSVSTSQIDVSIINDDEAQKTTDTKIAESKTVEMLENKSTEKISSDKSTTKYVDDKNKSVSKSQTDIKSDPSIEHKDFAEIKPLTLDDMLHLFKQFSEKIITLAKTSVDKTEKISTNLYSELQTNIQTIDNYIQEIAKRMNMFQVHLNKLTEAFNKRFLNDKAKDQAFDKLYESMQEYKDDFLANAKKPVFLDLIRLNDDIQKMLASNDENDSADSETNKKLELVSDVIIEILYRNDIDVITEAPEQFDRNFQKAVKRISTDSKDMDRKVDEILKIGFIHGSQIIRPQEVSVYIYEAKD